MGDALVGEHPVVARQPTSTTSPGIGEQETNGDAPEATSQQAEVYTEVTGEQESTGNCEVAYIIRDEKSSFISFMEALRVKLAEHPDREDIMDLHTDANLKSTRSHPMLPKQRADGEQPARWIEVELQVVKDSEETTSTTLVIRDDNMDIMGFMNQNGAWYELGYQRMLPQEYRSKLLGWGNSYKSILGVRKEEEVMDRLMCANLGKTFATHAVRLLSRFDPNVVADVYNLRLALVGLMFMISESAKMNPVHNAITRGWDTGKGFTKELMINYVWKYVEMSRRLREWKRRNYADPQPNSELLDAIYLVLNGTVIPFL
ncbi:60 kDa jasmonate-induced protein-like [Miscanthus floridulus]|uniref:60 kDa jasmonate-induced protein-like n=1 Tax=Miscanthus floridulus TaxID=154761 RepID=UPI00345787DE